MISFQYFCCRLSPNRTTILNINNSNTTNGCREQNEINEMKKKNLLNRKDITFTPGVALGEHQQQEQQSSSPSQQQQQQTLPPQFVDLKSITAPGTGTTIPSQTTLVSVLTVQIILSSVFIVILSSSTRPICILRTNSNRDEEIVSGWMFSPSSQTATSL